jgi:amino acid transporter
VLQVLCGRPLAVFVSVIFVVSVVAGGVVGQVGASRVLYGMGRDGVLPNKVFGYLHPKHRTPTWNILVLYVLSVGGALVLSLAVASEIVSFGAITGFMMVNLSVISYFYIRRGERREWVKYLLFPLLGFSVSFVIWIEMNAHAKEVGFTWLAIGIIYLAVMTRAFRVAPKELSDVPAG